jgi:hypothetical protein
MRSLGMQSSQSESEVLTTCLRERDRSSFRVGSILELCVDANAIPAGQYRLVDESDDIYTFTIGEEILFGMAKEYWAPFLRKVPASRIKRTTKGQFLDQYWMLMMQASVTESKNPVEAFTFCVLSERLHRRGRL